MSTLVENLLEVSGLDSPIKEAKSGGVGTRRLFSSDGHL